MADLRRCEGTIGELLSAYLDGELRPGEIDVVVSHLEGCEDCVAEFRSLKEARTALRLVPMLQVPDRALQIAHYAEELSAYLDGELATAELEIVTTHLETCSDCRSELHELDSARTAVRSLPTLELPILLDVERSVRRPGSRSRRIVAAVAGAAAVLAIAVGLSGSPAPGEGVDFDAIAERHNARASVEDGFSVVPAGFVPVGSP